MDYLGLKDSSRQLRANCAISYSFYLHLMLHTCAARFDVTGDLKKFWILVGSKQGMSNKGKPATLRHGVIIVIKHAGSG